MPNNLWKKTFVLGIIISFVFTSFVPLSIGKIKDSYRKVTYNYNQENEGTEYWALIFAVGVYRDDPDDMGGWNDRPSMLKSAENLYEVLLNSPNWQADHIHKVTAEAATGRRLIKELIWLILNEDRDDMSLIYLTTHGSPLKGKEGNFIDIPPRDEEDGADEILIMYDGFVKWYAFIWDDLLNFFLSLLQSKGVCLIIDSCHSGGFNDDPLFTRTSFKEYTAESFTNGLVGELSGKDRIVLMSCEENETSYGSYFSDFLIDGLWGAGDFWGNNDGINSAEETFQYAKFWVNKTSEVHPYFTPTIFDLYPGEYPVTYSKSFN